jgi:hypothetical protein
MKIPGRLVDTVEAGPGGAMADEVAGIRKVDRGHDAAH